MHKGEKMKQSVFTVKENKKLTDGVMKMILQGDTSDITAPVSYTHLIFLFVSIVILAFLWVHILYYNNKKQSKKKVRL